MANQCLLKVGAFAADLEQYDKAISQFETVAARSLDNNLTKFSLREYLFKAGLCQLAKNVKYFYFHFIFFNYYGKENYWTC